MYLALICYRINVCLPSPHTNPYVEALTPNVIAFGDRACEEMIIK